MSITPRIGLDQGCPRSSATLLNAQGFDALHVGDEGMARATDWEIIQWAVREKRTIITLDSDFHMLLSLHKLLQPSVIRIRQAGLNGERLAALIIRVWPQIALALTNGAAITVTNRDMRVRLLPIIGHAGTPSSTL